MCACVSVNVSANNHRTQSSRILWSHQTWVLGTQLWSLGRAPSHLSSWDSSNLKALAWAQK